MLRMMMLRMIMMVRSMMMMMRRMIMRKMKWRMMISDVEKEEEEDVEDEEEEDNNDHVEDDNDGEVDDDDDDDDEATAQKLGPHFVRPCAVDMNFNMSQGPLYTEIYRKNAGAQSEHPDQAPAFTATVRTPQCGHTVWGKTYSVFAFCVTIGAVSKRRQPNSSNQTCQAKGKVEKNRKTLFQHGQLFLASLNGKNPTLSGWYVYSILRKSLYNSGVPFVLGSFSTMHSSHLKLSPSVSYSYAYSST